jgi:hypothetical protein
VGYRQTQTCTDRPGIHTDRHTDTQKPQNCTEYTDSDTKLHRIPQNTQEYTENTQKDTQEYTERYTEYTEYTGIHTDQYISIKLSKLNSENIYYTILYRVYIQ